LALHEVVDEQGSRNFFLEQGNNFEFLHLSKTNIFSLSKEIELRIE